MNPADLVIATAAVDARAGGFRLRVVELLGRSSIVLLRDLDEGRLQHQTTLGPQPIRDAQLRIHRGLRRERARHSQVMRSLPSFTVQSQNQSHPR
jgi:hypothetical protein